MRKTIIASFLLTVALTSPNPISSVLDVHPWNKIATPFTKEKVFWRFHHCKTLFPNYAMMEISETTDKPWIITYPIGTKKGREIFSSIKISWKKGGQRL